MILSFTPSSISRGWLANRRLVHQTIEAMLLKGQLLLIKLAPGNIVHPAYPGYVAQFSASCRKGKAFLC
ncbi:hypothetical protein [Desulfobacter sp. UBA2225]|uniref:hypothetical protein n=1 Tax=Desulfobacter sp. UBA2225 TaxID=1961413 RepID=UPI00257AE339|nr:hypothetical protein [Desulfobacter sp. UBA2225]